MARNKHIPVNTMDDDGNSGIAIDRISIRNKDFKTALQYEEATRSHRDEGHTFHIVEKGSVLMEIDFQEYEIKAPTVVYMHPDQVHRIIGFRNVTVCSLAIDTEHLQPELLRLLEQIAPVRPMVLTREAYICIAETFSLCLRLSKQKRNSLFRFILKEGCNTLAALITSAFLDQHQPPGNPSRPEAIATAFRQLLEQHYRSDKRPAVYAGLLHISTHYLNECVKSVTGISVSQHIQDRIILEAKRQLHHTGRSVKEIAFDLGYEDYAYFSRLFTKVTGISAGAFRDKRHD